MLPAETSKPETPEAEALLRAAARDLKTIYDDVELATIDVSDVAEIIQAAQGWQREAGSMAQPQQGTHYTNETQIAVTCTVCGHRWQMTYGELQHTRVIYRGDAPASRPCAGEEYHVTCRNPRHAEVFVFCLPAKE